LVRIGRQSTAMISTLSPLLTICFSVLLFGEPFILFDGIGTALMLGGIGLRRWQEPRKPSV
jgi:drug/metabolite transporter (DMT)-like permease